MSLSKAIDFECPACFHPVAAGRPRCAVCGEPLTAMPGASRPAAEGGPVRLDGTSPRASDFAPRPVQPPPAPAPPAFAQPGLGAGLASAATAFAERAVRQIQGEIKTNRELFDEIKSVWSNDPPPAPGGVASQDRSVAPTRTQRVMGFLGRRVQDRVQTAVSNLKGLAPAAPQGQPPTARPGGDAMGFAPAAPSGVSGSGRRPDPHAGAPPPLRVSIRFLEAILGATKQIALPDGSSIEVEIPAGVQDGQTLRIRRPGPSPLGESGELRIGVSVEASHWLFTRQGDDVRLELSITPAEAAQGAKVRLPAPTGVIVLTTPREARDGATLRLKGKGVPGRGDQLVRLKVMAPESTLDPARLAEEVRRSRAEMEAWHAFDLGHCEGVGQRYAQALVAEAAGQGAEDPRAAPPGPARSP